MQEKLKWTCRVASSLGGGFAGTPEKVWGTPQWKPEDVDIYGPTVFFGLYGLPDFYALWRHKGRKAILWAGSDITHFINGYWLDDKGEIRIEPQRLAEWINKNCENYVENGVEHEELMVLGIESKIVPSFLGDVKDYNIEFKYDQRPKVYASVSGDNFDMYGWSLIEHIADRCNVDFFLYGNKTPWESKHSNVFVRGRVSQEEMNNEIKSMSCGLRTLEHDGFSEITAKSILWGQYPISYIGYPHVDSFKTREELVLLLNNLVNKTSPNIQAREYYLKNVNKYPWNENN